MPTIQEIRQKYPQYNDMSDADLASSLHKKFYSDMPEQDFNAKIGLKPTQAKPTQEPMSVGGLISNVGENIVDIAKGTYGMVRHPVDTGVALSTLAAGLISKVMPHPEGRPRPADIRQAEQVAEQVIGAGKEAIKHPIRTAYEHPLDVALTGAVPALKLAKLAGIGKITEATRIAKLPLPVKQSMIAKYDKTLEPIVRKGFSGTTGFKAKTARDINAELTEKATAVKTIINNKSNLELPSGKAIPTSVEDMTQAIEQTKHNLWNNEIAPAMGKTTAGGFRISVQNSINGLEKVIQDRTLVGSKARIKDAAVKLQDDLIEIQKQGGLTIEEAQKYMSSTNVDAGAWFKKSHPDFDTDLAMRIGVSHDLKNEFNRVIDLATGADMQGLKAQYKSLLSIEEDMNKLRNKQWKKSFGANTASYWEIGTDWGLLHGAMSGNIPALLSAAGAKGMVMWKKYSLNPDKYISNMMKDGEKIVEKQSQISSTIPKPVRPTPKQIGYRKSIGMEDVSGQPTGYTPPLVQPTTRAIPYERYQAKGHPTVKSPMEMGMADESFVTAIKAEYNNPEFWAKNKDLTNLKLKIDKGQTVSEGQMNTLLYRLMQKIDPKKDWYTRKTPPLRGSTEPISPTGKPRRIMRYNERGERIGLND